jgi:hypothetical protein
MIIDRDVTTTSYVLDCEGLSQAALGRKTVTAELKDAYRSDIRVLTSSMTLIEAYHDRIPRAAWRWTMSRVAVVPVTEQLANEAITLLKETGLHGHKYAIDAALAAIVRRLPGDVVVFTSDEDGMTKLCGAHAVIEPL